MKSIKGRLLLGLLAVIVLSTVVSTTMTYFALKEEMDELFDESMKQIAHAIAVHDMTVHSDFISGSTDIRRTLKGEEEFLIQVWKNDQISFSSKPAILFPNHGPGGVVTVVFENEEWRYYGLDVADGWLIQVSQPIPIRHTVIWEIYFEQLIPTLIQLPILMALVWIVVGLGFTPLVRISESIEKRTARFLERLSEEDIPKEVSTMVQAINGLLGRLSKALDVQRRFSADAAHELRTPLTAVRLELDVLKRAETEEEKQQSLEKLYSAVDRSSHLVHQLLEMARLEPEQATEEISTVALYKIIQSITLEMQQAAKTKGLNLLVEGADNITVRGRPNALAVLASNLISNAIQYTPKDGKVVVSVSEKNGHACLSVSDNGPGIPEKERERIFDRFYRILNKKQAGVTGSGLGLSIVKSIADSHNATIEVRDGLDTNGVCFEITFP